MPPAKLVEKNCASILSKLSEENYKLSFSFINDKIYELLVTRALYDDLKSIFGSFEKDLNLEFNQKLSKFEDDMRAAGLVFSSYTLKKYKIVDEGQWFQVGLNRDCLLEMMPKDSAVLPRMSALGNDFTLHHKAYFTVVMPSTPEEVAALIKKFFDFLRLLRSNLDTLAIQLKYPIDFKFNISLNGFLEHADSLVVYYSDPKDGETINKAVMDVADKFSLEFHKRVFRTKFGFDFHPKRNFSNEVLGKLSHSRIVSTKIAFKIINNRDMILKNVSKPIQLSELIVSYLKEANEESAEEFYKWMKDSSLVY